VIECPVSRRHPSKRGELKSPSHHTSPQKGQGEAYFSFEKGSLPFFPLCKVPFLIPPFIKGARGI